MKEALNALPNREKTIIISRYIYGYRDGEIGQELKISRQAVHKARKKALLHLDDYLRKGVI